MADPPPLSASDQHLQPFFILHRESSSEASTELGHRLFTTRRKIGGSMSPAKSRSNPELEAGTEELDDRHYGDLRYRTFERIWSKIEEEINAVLRRIDRNLFDELHQWVLECFAGIESARADFQYEILQPYPVFNDVICQRIPTGLILTRNAEFVDDLLTFRELGVYLKSKGCHIAYFSSHDFDSKHGAGDCLRSLLRQVASIAPDVADMSVLSSWYCGVENAGKPIVIIVDDTEQCSGTTMGEFILILSEWVIKLPVILIFGVATSINAPKKLLHSSILQRLQLFKFTLESSHERMNSIVEAVLVRQCFGFCIGYKVASFLRNYFVNHDGTLTSFVKALKISCAKHFCMEPLSFLVRGMLDGGGTKDLLEEDCEALPKKLLDMAFNLSSCGRGSSDKISGNAILCGLQELWKVQKRWSSVLLCLFEVGKVVKIPLLDLFCDALNPLYLRRQQESSPNTGYSRNSSKLDDGTKSWSGNGASILQAVQKTRDLPVESLVSILKLWEGHFQEISGIRDELHDLKMICLSGNEETTLKQGHDHVSRPLYHVANAGSVELSNKAATLLDNIVRDYLTPIECIPFHEIICFKQVSVLQEALIGDPRRSIQLDLRQSRTQIHCDCCPRDGKVIVSSSMHDTSIIYSLAQEFGDVINLHDWYQSFKGSILSSNKRAKREVRSPSSKKANVIVAHSDATEAMTQARFCLAVKELQLVGLLRMPSKRRPDYVQRVAFGI